MRTFTVRLEDEVNDELEALSQLLQVSKNQVISDTIRQSYNSLIGGDPKVKEAIDKLQEFRSMLEKLADK